MYIYIFLNPDYICHTAVVKAGKVEDKRNSVCEISQPCMVTHSGEIKVISISTFNSNRPYL